MASVSVGSSPTLIINPKDTALAGRNGQIFIKNIGTATIYLGTDDEVSIGNGFPLDAGESMEAEGGAGRVIYGITSGTTESVRTLIF